jgi:hypothetical protein
MIDHQYKHILIEDNRPFQQDSRPRICPKCGHEMLYSSESYTPTGDLFACILCRTGWLEITVGTWKEQVRGKYHFPSWSWGAIESAGRWIAENGEQVRE